MKLFYALMVLSPSFSLIQAMNHTRLRSWTDSDINYSDSCEFQKAYHRIRRHNKKQEKIKKRFSQTQNLPKFTNVVATTTALTVLKSPKSKTQSSPLMTQKRLSPSLGAIAQVKETAIINK